MRLGVLITGSHSCPVAGPAAAGSGSLQTPFPGPSEQEPARPEFTAEGDQDQVVPSFSSPAASASTTTIQIEAAEVFARSSKEVDPDLSPAADLEPARRGVDDPHVGLRGGRCRASAKVTQARSST